MGVPAFGTAGTRSVSASAATLTPALPASIVANDALIALCTVNATGKTFGAITGWTQGDSSNTGNLSATWFWRLATGTDSAPAFTWTGAAACAARVFRFTGAAASFVGVHNNATANASGTETIAGITTTAANSAILAILTSSVAQNWSTTFNGVPLGWPVVAQDSSGDGSAALYLGAINDQGTSQSISITLSTGNWVSFGIEILGSGVSAGSPVRVTQATLQVLRTVSSIAFDTTLARRPKIRNYIDHRTH